MHAPMLAAIAKHAVAEGFDVLRFNFRGVGGSTGSHGDGHTEMHDIDAAMAHLTHLGIPLAGTAGWSFGASVLLNWQAQTESQAPYVGIAPPVRSPLTPDLPDPSELAIAPRRFIIGERDQFIPADELEAYATAISAETVRYRGTDHFFVLKHNRVAKDVVSLMGSSIH
jgi:alpha/beta superfamily hydrolase